MFRRSRARDFDKAPTLEDHTMIGRISRYLFHSIFIFKRFVRWAAFKSITGDKLTIQSGN